MGDSHLGRGESFSLSSLIFCLLTCPSYKCLYYDQKQGRKMNEMVLLQLNYLQGLMRNQVPLALTDWASVSWYQTCVEPLFWCLQQILKPKL